MLMLWQPYQVIIAFYLLINLILSLFLNSGFGRYSDSHSRTSEVVLFTHKRIITNAECAARFPGLVVDSTICAQGETGINNSVCNGDSGGPLSIIRDGASYQVGGKLLFI